ncbi:MAG: hypothetical protein WBV82_20590 [Myxococcaceae bacterium]
MERGRIHLLLLDGVALAALLLACAVLLGGLEDVLDLAPWDEADYLRQGRSLSSRGLPDPEWGPLYVAWYAALAWFGLEPIASYYASQTVLVTLSCALIFGCARRLGAPAGVALMGALLFLLSGAPHVSPRPTLLALGVTLAALFASTWVRTFPAACAALGLGLLVASFARPEFFVSFVAVTGVFLVSVARRRGWPARRWMLAGYATPVLVLFGVFGNPFGDATGRRMFAFCQHYALGEVERSALPLNPWAECGNVLEQSFGEIEGVSQAFLRNPAAFLVHVGHNAARYPVASVGLFSRGFGDARPDRGPWTITRTVQLTALMVVLCAAGLALWRRRPGPGGALSRATVQRSGLALGAILAPAVLSALLIYPREHYLVLQGVFVPLFAVACLAESARPGPDRETWSAPSWAMIMAVLAVAPALTLSPEPIAPRPNLAVVKALSDLKSTLPARPDQPIHIFELQGGYDAYLGPDFERVPLSDRRPGESILAFLRRNDVQVVVLEPELERFRTLRSDAEFQAFAAAPEAWGFTVHPVGGTDRKVVIRRGDRLPFYRRR